MKPKTIKTLVIVAGVLTAGYFGWKYYKKTSAIRRAKKLADK